MSRSGLAEITVTPAVLRDWPLPEVGNADGKDGRRSVLVVGGSVRTPGALLLAGLAALRVGAGELKLATTRATATAVGVAVPEALVVALPETPAGEIADAGAAVVGELAGQVAAVLVGPGCTDRDAAGKLAAHVVSAVEALDDPPVLVIDALALSAFDAPASLGDRVILTPNAAEAAAMLGLETDDVQRDLGDAARQLSDRFDATVAVRQAETWITGPGRPAYRAQGGNAGLGTSGSGDVLAGAVAGLAARGADPLQAALWGVHLHGEAGARLAERIGPVGYLARELLGELPGVMAGLP